MLLIWQVRSRAAWATWALSRPALTVRPALSLGTLFTELVGGHSNDCGHWNFSPEWMGSQDGGFGSDDGKPVYSAVSSCGNGQVLFIN